MKSEYVAAAARTCTSLPKYSGQIYILTRCMCRVANVSSTPCKVARLNEIVWALRLDETLMIPLGKEHDTVSKWSTEVNATSYYDNRVYW